MGRFAALLILLFPTFALAAGDGVPVITIVSQITNLSILVFILSYFFGKTVLLAFQEKRQAYLDQLGAASAAKTQAEEKLREVTARLAELRTTASRQLEKAEKQAADEGRQLVEQSQQEAKRLVIAAQAGVDYEAQKLLEGLRLEAFAKSSQMAEKKLKETLTPEQQRAWNNHFAEAREIH